jgi:group II intron reverse transcriptase/maturase
MGSAACKPQRRSSNGYKRPEKRAKFQRVRGRVTVASNFSLEKEDKPMLSDELIKRLEGIEDASKKGYPIRNLYRLMCEPRMWLQAYSNIRANNGAITPGVSGEDTIDGFSLEKAEKLAQLMRDRHYVARPVRRVEIPKKDGRTRPLGIPGGTDKLAQEVARMILERVYEPVFSDGSHGFRPGRSCHTALSDIRPKWSGVKWLIDVDVKGFFDNISHKKLLEVIAKKVDDKSFLNVIEQWLKAGYVDKWVYHRTFSGTPQGGIISPLLANIYLHELDMFVEGMIATYNKGDKRKINPEMNRLAHMIHQLRRKVDAVKGNPTRKGEVAELREEIDALLEAKRQIPSQVTDDPNFRRMYYLRYADDFLLGVIGSKQEAEHIARQVKSFITDSLGLEVNEAKTKVSHVREGIRFLSYTVRELDSVKVMRQKMHGRHTLRRTTNSIIQLFVPDDVPSTFCRKNGYGDWETCGAAHRTILLPLSEAEIILTYNAEMRGLANYYTMACDMKYRLSRLYFVWQRSLFKTLANKRRSNVAKVARTLKQANGEYTLRVPGQTRTREIEVLKLKHIDRKKSVVVDEVPLTARITTRSTELVRRLEARQCEYCGARGKCEVHHVRKLKDAKKRRNGAEPALWQRMMMARNRKTLILCEKCHDRLHAGTLPDLRHMKPEKATLALQWKEA